MKDTPSCSLPKRSVPKSGHDDLVSVSDVMGALRKIPGGYVYSGACSYQLCFPLKEGGELRFSIVDDDQLENPDEAISIDLYGAEIPGGVTGPAFPTGEHTHCEHTSEDHERMGWSCDFWPKGGPCCGGQRNPLG